MLVHATKCARSFDRSYQLVPQFLVALIRRKIQTIETGNMEGGRQENEIRIKRTYQVWERGKLCDSPQRSIVNNCGPLLPYSSLNPFIGTREVPVTNCRRRDLISLLNESTTWTQRNQQLDDCMGKGCHNLPSIATE